MELVVKEQTKDRPESPPIDRRSERTTIETEGSQGQNFSERKGGCLGSMKRSTGNWRRGEQLNDCKLEHTHS